MDFRKLNELFIVYEFARDAHEGQKRRTGLDYITHPIAVAKIAKAHGADESTVHACLLHDVVEDTDVSSNDISHSFGYEVSFLVDGVTNEDDEERTHLKIRDYSERDKRVILIKLADRLHNLPGMDNSELFRRTLKKYKASTPFYVELGRQHGYHDLSQKVEECLDGITTN